MRRVLLAEGPRPIGDPETAEGGDGGEGEEDRRREERAGVPAAGEAESRREEERRGEDVRGTDRRAEAVRDRRVELEDVLDEERQGEEAERDLADSPALGRRDPGGRGETHRREEITDVGEDVPARGVGDGRPDRDLEEQLAGDEGPFPPTAPGEKGEGGDGEEKEERLRAQPQIDEGAVDVDRAEEGAEELPLDEHPMGQGGDRVGPRQPRQPRRGPVGHPLARHGEGSHPVGGIAQIEEAAQGDGEGQGERRLEDPAADDGERGYWLRAPRTGDWLRGAPDGEEEQSRRERPAVEEAEHLGPGGKP